MPTGGVGWGGGSSSCVCGGMEAWQELLGIPTPLPPLPVFMFVHPIRWFKEARLRLMHKTGILLFLAWGTWWCPLLPMYVTCLSTLLPFPSLPFPNQRGGGGVPHVTGVVCHRRRDNPINTVIGNPIKLPLIPNPTAADVKKYHAIYVEKLVDLFERNKERFGYGDRKLNLY